MKGVVLEPHVLKFDRLVARVVVVGALVVAALVVGAGLAPAAAEPSVPDLVVEGTNAGAVARKVLFDPFCECIFYANLLLRQ